MSQHKGHRRSEIIEAGVEEMKLDTRSTHLERGRSRTGGLRDDSIAHDGPLRHDVKMESGSESKSRQEKSSPSLEKHEEVIGGDVTVKLEPGQPPKLTRSTSQRIVAGPSQLFDDKPSKTAESKSHFQLIAECTYANKHLGYTEHGSMDCDCTEEWGMRDSTSYLYTSSIETLLISLQIPLRRLMKLVETIQIASIERRKWSASAIAGAELIAKTKGSNGNNSQQ